MIFSETDEGKIDGFVDAGSSIRLVAIKYGWKKTAAGRYVREYKITGKFTDRLYFRGQKRKTSNQTYISIGRAVIGSPINEHCSSAAIAADFNNRGIDISEQTVCRRLAEQGLRGRIAAKKTFLCANNIKKDSNWHTFTLIGRHHTSKVVIVR